MALLFGWYMAMAVRGMIGGSIIYLLIKSFFLLTSKTPHQKIKLLAIPLLILILLMSPSLFSFMWKNPEILWSIAIILFFTGVDFVEKSYKSSSQLSPWWNFLNRSGKVIAICIGVLLVISIPIALIDKLAALNVLMNTVAAAWFLFLECLRQRNHTLQLQHDSRDR